MSVYDDQDSQICDRFVLHMKFPFQPPAAKPNWSVLFNTNQTKPPCKNLVLALVNI